MSNQVDQRVVQMKFDNGQFEKGVSTTMGTLDKLKEKLKLKEAAKGFENVTAAANKTDVSAVGRGVEAISVKFSAMEVMAVTALANITNSAVNAGKRIVSALTIDPIKTGLDEYNTKMGAIQVIQANTRGKNSMSEITDALDELNTYADKTIYNFAQMTSNVGKFTAQGMDVQSATKAIQGMANLAAASGASAEDMSRATYQMSQALGGTIRKIDWNSLRNANMATTTLKDTLKDVAKVSYGLDVDKMIEAKGTFEDTLELGWLTGEMFTEAMNMYSGVYDEATLKSKGYTDAQIKNFQELAKMAESAATEVKTVSQLWDVLKETAQSGWTQSWEFIIGDFETAKRDLTKLQVYFSDIIDASSNARNEVLKQWNDLHGRDMVIRGLVNVWNMLLAVIEPIRDAFRDLFPPTTATQLVSISRSFERLTKVMQLNVQKNATKLQRTFKGLFSIFKLVSTVVGGVLKAAFVSISKVTGGINNSVLDVTASFGDMLYNFNMGIIKSDALKSALDGVETVLSAVFKAIGFVVSAISSGIGWIEKIIAKIRTNEKVVNAFNIAIATVQTTAISTFNKIKAKFEAFSKSKYVEQAKNSLDKFVEALKDADLLADGFQLDDITAVFELFSVTVGEYLDNVGITLDDLKQKFIDFKNSITGKADEAADGIGGATEKIRDTLSGYIEQFSGNTFTFYDVAAFLMGGFTIKSIISLSNLLKGLGSPLMTFSDVLIQLKSTLFGIQKDLKIKAWSSAIKDFAISIGILVGSLWVISKIPADRLNDSMHALETLMLMMSTMAVVLAITNKYLSESSIATAGSMIAIAASVYILALALEKVNEATAGMDWKQVGVNILYMAGMMATLVGGMFLLSLVAPAVTANAFVLVGLAAALFLVVEAFKRVDEYTLSDNLYNNLDKITGVLAMMAGIALISSKVAGDWKSGIGMLAVAASLLVFMYALEKIANFPFEDLKDKIGYLIGIFVIFGVMMLATRLAGQYAKEAGTMLLMMSVSVMILTEAIKNLADVNKADINKASIAIGGLMAVMAALIFVTKYSGENAAKAGLTLLAMAAAMNLLVIVIKALGIMPREQLIQGGVAVGILIILLDSVLLASKLAENAWGSIAMIGLVLVALTGSLYLLASIADDGLLEAAKALDGTMIVLIGMLTALNFFKLTPKDLITIGLIELTVAGLAVILTIMTNSIKDPTAAIPIAEGLSTLLLAMSVSLGILAAVGTFAPAAGAGILALDALIADLVLVAAGLSLFDDKMRQRLQNGLDTLAMLGEGLGNFVGQMIDGFLTGATENLPLVGARLTAFGASVNLFATQISGIDTSTIDSVKTITEIISELGSMGIEDALVGWVNADYLDDEFPKKLNAFGEAMVGYSNVVAGKIDKTAVEASANAGSTLVSLIRDMPVDGAFNNIFGDADLETFGNQLTAFGQAMVDYSSVVGAEGAINEEAISASARAGKMMTDMADTIPNSGGALGAFLGNNNIDTFGAQLRVFGQAIVDYSAIVGEEGAINETAIEASKRAGEMMIEMADTIPNSGGLIGFLVGNNNLDTFGEQLKKFGQALVDYSGIVSEEGAINADAIQEASRAASGLVTLANRIPNTGLFSLFSGQDISAFGSSLWVFGAYFKKYANEVKNIKAEDLEGSTAAAQACAELAGSLEGVNLGGIFSDSDLESFGQALAAFGRSFYAYYDAIKWVNTEKMAAAITELDKLIKVANGLNDMPAISDNTSKFSEALGKLAETGVKKFTKEFKDGYKTANESISNMLKKCIKTIKSYQTSSKKDEDSFYTAGAYLVDGFIAGINSKIQEAANAAAAMAHAAMAAAMAALDEHSPSREMFKVGDYFDQGFINGIDSKVSDAEHAGANIANAAKNSLASAIQHISNIVDGDMNMSPTIRPVLDLSDVRAKAATLDTMFSSNLAMSAGAGFDYNRSLRDRSNQNGVDTDRPTSVTFTQNNYSPKALDRVEIYRQTNNQFTALKEALR